MPNGDELDTLISSLPAAGAPPPAAPKTPKPKKSNDPLSAIRERNPDFAKTAEDFLSFASARGVPDAYIKSGYRTAKEQNDIFNGPRGRYTKGNDGYIKLSPHQEARAIDWSTKDPKNRAALHRLISVFAQKHKLHVPVDEPWHMSGAPAKRNGSPVLAPTDSDSLDAVLRDVPVASPSAPPVPESASQPESLADSATPTSTLTPPVSQTPAPSRYQMSPAGLQQPTPSPAVRQPEDSHYTPPKPPEGAQPGTELSAGASYDVPIKPFDVERVGALGAIGNAGSEAQQAYLDFVRRNAQPVKGKPVNIDQAAADETMARTFMQIQTLFRDQPNASSTETTKAIAQMGLDFLRDPATKGQVMPRVLHEAMLSAQWTSEETKTLPGKLRTQIQQRDVKHRVPQVQRGAQTTPIAIFRGDDTNNPYFTIQGVSTYFNSPDEMKAALDHLGVQIDWRGPFGGLIHANIPGRVVRQAPRSADPDALKKEQASQFIQNAIYGTPQMGDAERERLTQAEEAKGQEGEEAIKAAIGFSPEMNLLPTDLQNWIGGFIAKGAAGLTEQVAGAARDWDLVGLGSLAEPAYQLITGNKNAPLGQQAANKINAVAEEISSGALSMDRKARRGGLSQTAQDVLGGTISSAPALALTALGVPAPVSFGLQSYLSARGRDAELSELLLETGKGATIGALFELPIPAKLQILTKIGAKLGPLGKSAGTAVERGTLVGGGTYGLERATGAPHPEALKSAIVNALFASSNEAMKIARAGGAKAVEQIRKLGGQGRAGAIRSDQAQPIQTAPELQRQGTEGARSSDLYREGQAGQPEQPGEVAPQRQPAPSDVVSEKPEGQVPVQGQPEIVEPSVTQGLQSKEQANEPIPSTAKAQPAVKPGIAKAQAEAKAERAPEIRETAGPALPRVAGADTDISIPGTSRKYKARYVLREADDLQASHNPENFQPNPKYPYQNDRRYESEKQYQTQVIQRSSSTGPEPFDPRHLVNNSPTSDTGPPAITEDGHALGGNSRVMIAKRVYANNPEGAAAYKTWLKENAASFGLDPAQVDGMKQPVLAREISNEGLRSSSDIQEAITQLNVTATTPLTREEQGMSGANRMTSEGMDFIAQKIESMGEDATLAKAMDRHGVDIVNRLISDGVVAPGDRNVLIKDGKPTPEAKTRIERLLTGRVYRDIDQMGATAPSVKTNIERVVPYLTQTEGTDWDLIPTVRRSLDAIAESKASKIPIDELNAQASMTRGENYSPEEVAIAQALLKGPRQAAEIFRSYASDYQNEVSGQEGLFGPAKTQAQSFDEKFGTGGDELDRALEGVPPIPVEEAVSKAASPALGVSEPQPSLINQVSEIVDERGNLTRGGDYVNSLMKGRSNAEVQDLLQWTRRQNEHVQRFVGANVIAELRSRGIDAKDIPEAERLATESQARQLVNTLKWNMAKAKGLSEADAQTVIDKGIDFNDWANAKSEARRQGYPLEQVSRVAIDHLSGKLPTIPSPGSSSDPYRVAPSLSSGEPKLEISGMKPQEDVTHGRQAAEIQNLPPAESAKAAESVNAPPTAAASGERSGLRPSSAEPATTGRSDTGIEPAKEAKAESVTFQASVLPGAKEFVEHDLIPSAVKAGSNIRAVVQGLKYMLAPRRGVARDTLDAVMKMKGERDKADFVLEASMKDMKKYFNGLPQDEQIGFVDRMKRGEKQPNEYLQQVADMMREVDTKNWERAQEADIPLKWLDNHYRVLWKVIPGTESAKQGFRGVFRRPLRGSRSMMKRHTLEDMSEGIALGGEPVSYNPVTMFELAQADLMKFITAQNLWNWGRKNKLTKWVPEGRRAPEGYVQVKDSIAKRYFRGPTGMVKVGEWHTEEGFARLLNNYLSKDYLRDVGGAQSPTEEGIAAAGRSLLWVKNNMTAVELGLSAFHAVFESGEAVSAQMGLGLRRIYNLGVLKGDPKEALRGIVSLITSPTAPATSARLGGSVIRFTANPEEFLKTMRGQDFIERFPDAESLISDLFTGGGRLAMHEDYRLNWRKKFQEAIGQGNYIGAAPRGVMAANEYIMAPLFEHYIPRLKVGLFLKEYSQALAEHQPELTSGKMTRPELARKTWDFVEDRFGEMNFDNLFWDRTLKTAAQITFRSVTWKLGNLRAALGAPGEQAREAWSAAKEKRLPRLTPKAAWLASMSMLTAAMGTVIMKAFTGKYPEKLYDFIYPQVDPDDDRERVSIPTYARDEIALARDPKHYLASSLSSELSRTAEIWANKDFYGEEVYSEDDPAYEQAWDITKHYFPLPFSVSSYLKFRKSGEPSATQLTGFVGFPKAPAFVSMTPMDEVVHDYYRKHEELRGKPRDEAEKQRAKRSIADKIRKGEDPGDELDEAMQSGLLKPRDLKDVEGRAKFTPRQLAFRGLPLPDALNAWDKADPKQRDEMRSILAGKLDRSKPDTFTSDILKQIAKSGMILPGNFIAWLKRGKVEVPDDVKKQIEPLQTGASKRFSRHVSEQRQERQAERTQRRSENRFLPPESRPTPNPNRRYQVMPR